MIDAIVQGFTYLLQKVVDALAWVGQLFVAVFAALWDLWKDGWSWLFDQVLGLAVAAGNAIDVSAITGTLGVWQQIPPGMLEVIEATGAGAALAVIGSALVIRLLLQLIPFVRLGS